MPKLDIDTDPVSLLVDGALLLADAHVTDTGRAVRSLGRTDHAPLRQTLVALAPGAVLADHAQPETASVQVIAGQVRLHEGDHCTVLSHGELVSLPAGPHWLDAVEDAVLLVTVSAT